MERNWKAGKGKEREGKGKDMLRSDCRMKAKEEEEGLIRVERQGRANECRNLKLWV